MRAEICPTCEGWCCRDGSEMHVEHRNTRYAKHVCPDCRTGMVWTEHTKSAPKPTWTAEQERAAVVAWLRKGWDESRRYAADAIERGEHRKEEE